MTKIMLKIIREDLTCLNNDKEVARYEDITIFTGNKFIEIMAQNEANSRDDILHISFSREEIDNHFHHVMTLVNHKRQCVVKYKGIWE